MITQYEVPALLRESIPSLAQKAYPNRGALQVYAAINYFTDYTRSAIEAHDLDLAKQCFLLADKLYQNGDRLVRLLIENSFIYAFTSFLSFNQEEKLLVKSIIPEKLYSVYISQVTHNGY